MQNKIIILGTLLLFFLFTSTLYSQESLNSAGGTYRTSGGSISFSVGQVVYTTNQGLNGSVSQGIQQPYEISEVTGIEEVKGITLNIFSYPNPIKDHLTLVIENYDEEDLSYQLYDIMGNLFDSNKLTGSETDIDMSNLAPATYFLKVVNIQATKTQQIKKFKIIKN
jgi:hypothetical protein